MISFEDPRWGGLKGGYRVEYDPRPALRTLEVAPGNPDAWAELWENLHHQGDVGEASYVAAPHLVALQPSVGRDHWPVYSMVALIERRRGEGGNPPVPDWLKAGYLEALTKLGALAVVDVREVSDVLVKPAALGVFALTNGLRRWGPLISEMSEDEVFEALGWE